MLIITILHLTPLFEILDTLLELILVRLSYLLPFGINPFARYSAG